MTSTAHLPLSIRSDGRGLLGETAAVVEFTAPVPPFASPTPWPCHLKEKRQSIAAKCRAVDIEKPQSGHVFASTPRNSCKIGFKWAYLLAFFGVKLSMFLMFSYTFGFERKKMNCFCSEVPSP